MLLFEVEAEDEEEDPLSEVSSETCMTAEEESGPEPGLEAATPSMSTWRDLRMGIEERYKGRT